MGAAEPVFPTWARTKEILKRETTGRKLIFNFIWHGFHAAAFGYGWWLQFQDPYLFILNGLTFSIWMSRGAGLAMSFDATFILLPMLRNLLRVIRPKIKWLPLDESQWFHRQVAYSLLFWSIVHTMSHYVNFFNIERLEVRHTVGGHVIRGVDILYTEACGITGNVMLFCMLLMYTSAHHKIRQESFEAFWYTHHLFIPFFLALYTHATGCFVRSSYSPQPHSPFAGNDFWNNCIGYQSWRWELWGGGLYLVERLYREIRIRRETKITKVIRHPENAVEIQFQKPSMRYKAGQWLFINVPSVSGQQWHPFTITSCPYDPYISIHVRQLGDFTRGLGNALGAGQAQASEFEKLDPNGMYEIALQKGETMPKLRIDGPYGAPAEDTFDNEIAVLIGTGIGVTPWASILKNIWHLRAGQAAGTSRLKRVEFIWVCKDTKNFEWFQTLLSSLETQSQEEAKQEGVPEFLRIHTYLTQKFDVDAAANIHLNSVGTDVDPLTELKTRTNFGRPDFPRLFTAMSTAIQDGSYISNINGKPHKDVGVYFCGPNSAAKQIRSATKAVTTPEVKFKFWKEHF